METYTWIFKIILALFFIMPGVMKLKMSKEEMVRKGNITEDQSVYFPRFIGVAELCGVVVMLLSIWLKELETLAGIAAIGFAIVMVGAIIVHARKKEWKLLPVLFFALILSVLLAIANL
ncbi:DoxX family protein [Dyadobacter sp. CY345]|uniref:DoxX family protein n=1 Tax=Dyadobacter sp. CY345 TaxID=2909335 RepID=UPI001F37EF9A|nr:DoxX family protein [Dyadobacter sp. CY345]MCF2443953.1 DoxX family protein [Dyadobacter sp. CY345]